MLLANIILKLSVNFKIFVCDNSYFYFDNNMLEIEMKEKKCRNASDYLMIFKK